MAKGPGPITRSTTLALAVTCGVAALHGYAFAEATSEVLYSNKAWEVRVVAFDDGSISCLAQVTDGAQSFSMWSDASGGVKLQFYDESWNMGEGDTANLSIEIDSRGPWTLTNAELHLQSVFFDIPDSDQGLRLMNEVMGGNTLFLSTEKGEAVESYTLAGSRASIGVLIDCVDALSSDDNPFQ